LKGARSTVSDSYTLPGRITPRSIFARRCPWLLDEVLEALRPVMGYSLSADCEASREAFRQAELLRREGRLVEPVEVCRHLRARKVCVVGSSSTLRRQVGLLESCDTIVAADGASSFLESRGYTPAVIVSDLDGPIEALLRASRQGALLVAYLHGDNYRYASRLLWFFDRVVLSAQCRAALYTDTPLSGLVMPATGFTDGDRAAWLAFCCGASALTLIGMDTSAPSLAGTKVLLRSDTPPSPEKRAKLSIAELLLALLMVVQHYAGMEGWRGAACES